MKELILSVAELKQALPGLSRITGRKSTLPVLNHVRLTGDGKGNVSLLATDLEAFGTYRMKAASASSAIDVLLPLEQLAKTIKSCPSKDSIILTPEGKDGVRLRYFIGGSPVEQELTTMPVKEFPAVPIITGQGMGMEKEFGTALKQALAFCSTDASRYVLRGACLDVTDPKLHYVVGTNGRTLYSANSFAFDIPKSVIIPDSKFLQWPEFLAEAETCRLSIEPAVKNTPGWIRLETPRWTYVTKEIDGNYPNWKQVVATPDKKWTRLVLSDAAVKQLLDVIPKIPGNEGPNYPVRLSVDGNGQLHLEGRNQGDKEWTKIPIPEVTINGKPVAVSLNREFLAQGLRFGFKELSIQDELTVVIFVNGGRKLVVMPLNPGAPTVTASGPKPAPPTPAAKPAAEPTSPKPATETKTNERNEMPRKAHTTTANTTTQSTATEATETGSGLKGVVDQLDRLRETLKGVIKDLNQVEDAIKTAEKEKRTTEREIETVRTQLRKIQSVTI